MFFMYVNKFVFSYYCFIVLNSTFQNLFNTLNNYYSLATHIRLCNSNVVIKIEL